MTYREHRQARAARLAEWADKRDAQSAAAHNAATQIRDMIPFGQPILVGHHSEGAHRRAIARMQGNMTAAVEHADKADHMRSRAANIEAQLDGAIYDDDPDAIEQLEARIAQLEARREAIKAHNKATRGERGCQCPTGCGCRSPYEVTRCGCEAHPLPSYVLSNLAGNIKRNRDRVAILRREAAKPKPEAGAVIMRPANWPGYVEVAFGDKPARSVIDDLKAHGFCWNRTGACWVGKDRAFAESLTA